MKIIDKTLTRKVDKAVDPVHGLMPAADDQDLAKIALIPREGGKGGMGLVSGFSTRIGAVASSIAHETHSLMILGYDDDDMARAGNEVAAMGGGIVVFSKGKVIGRLPLTVGGVMAPWKIPRLARELDKLTGVLKKAGCPLEDPLWTLGFLSFTSLIELRITFSGVYEVKTGKILGNGFAKGLRF